MSEEVKQKQAEDCFPPSPAPLPSTLGWSVLLRQVTTLQLGESTLFFLSFFFLLAQLGTTSRKSAVQIVGAPL